MLQMASYLLSGMSQQQHDDLQAEATELPASMRPLIFSSSSRSRSGNRVVDHAELRLVRTLPLLEEAVWKQHRFSLLADVLSSVFEKRLPTSTHLVWRDLISFVQRGMRLD
jgi:hypothetical protein